MAKLVRICIIYIKYRSFASTRVSKFITDIGMLLGRRKTTFFDMA